MSSENLWREKSDEEILAEIEKIDDYTEKGQQALRAEAERRGGVEKMRDALHIDHESVVADDAVILDPVRPQAETSFVSDDTTGPSGEGVWICEKCDEECDGTFEICWNCGAAREGEPVTEGPGGCGTEAVESRRTRSGISGSARIGERSVRYQYKVVPFVGVLKGGLLSVEDAGEVSKQLEAVIEKYASRGWEFVTVNDVNIEIKPGCLAGLFGRETTYMHIDQVVFRRLAN